MPDDATYEEKTTREWYTVEEAAEYLDVSRPTIFRWMKDGKLSYYKVGGSTRFTHEGLDALIEKVTGRKEAEAAAGRCVCCGNTTLVEGDIRTTGKIYFHPDQTKFWTFQQSMVPTRAMVCTACGHIQLHADIDKLERLMPDEENEETADN